MGGGENQASTNKRNSEKRGRTCISLRFNGWTLITCSPLGLATLLGPACDSSVTEA